MSDPITNKRCISQNPGLALLVSSCASSQALIRDSVVGGIDVREIY
jgi:hypothetical protein